MTVATEVRERIISWCRKQFDKRYAYAADGPSSFDCSGYVMAAWRHGGITMPHNAREQSDFHMNPHVRTVKANRANKRKLQLADLVFYYPGITHVALYSGKKRTRPMLNSHMVVQATNEQLGIQEIGMFQYAKPVAYGFVEH